MQPVPPRPAITGSPHSASPDWSTLRNSLDAPHLAAPLTTYGEHDALHPQLHFPTNYIPVVSADPVQHETHIFYLFLFYSDRNPLFIRLLIHPD